MKTKSQKHKKKETPQTVDIQGLTVFPKVVEAARFELETFRTSSERSNQLSYASEDCMYHTMHL